MASRLEIAGPDVLRLFDQLERRVLLTSEIAATLRKNRDFWRLAQRTSTSEFIWFLSTKGKLKTITLRGPGGRQIVRYNWGDPSPYEIGLSLRSGTYLSHGTAIALHGLTDQVLSTIYVNKEQSSKPRAKSEKLTQEALDRAFSRRQRESSYVFRYESFRFVLLSGKSTGNLEVGELTGPAGERLRTTKLERTLIDATVRPNYAGGVHQVLQAYKFARERLSANVLLATLRKLDYLYPYHQAVGFYLDRAGYPQSAIELFRAEPMDFDFYLTHGLRQKDHDPRWRLFHPRGL